MTFFPLASCFLGLLISGISGLAQAPGQEKPKPRRRPDPDRKHEKVENLVKLADDFVQFARVPEGGLRPRLGVGKDGIALLYFKGEGPQGDLYLTRSSDEAKTFGPSLRLNPVQGTVGSWEGVHGGSLDAGPDGSAHVAWISGDEKPSLQYVRVAPESGAQAVVDLGTPEELCSTTALTVDAEGQIYVFYAAQGGGLDLVGKPGLRVWMRRSADGLSFSEPVAIDREDQNVSERSAIAAHVDEVMGTVFVLYRTAFALKPTSPSLSRGMRLLSSENRGESFTSVWVDNCRQQRDPRSGAGLTQDPDTTLCTWDAGGQVFWATIRRQLNKISLPMEPKAEGPAVWRTQAAGAAGGNEILLAWREQPEGDRSEAARLCWRVWFRDGRAPLGGGYAPEPPGQGTPVAFPRQAGGFTILY